MGRIPRLTEARCIALFRQVLGNTPVCPQRTFDFLRGNPAPGQQQVRRLPVDAFFPEHGLVLEYMGPQHFEPSALMDRRPGRREQRARNQDIRTEVLATNKIRLIRVRYDENLTEEMVRAKLLEVGITPPAPATIDDVVTRALRSFAEELEASGWQGREREAISYFAFGHLVPLCQPESVLVDPTQIGIEVAVPQLPGEERKAQVCKDLVIWPRPRMTCWDDASQPTVAPLAILEWKVGRPEVYSADVDWLCAFTAAWPGTIGYAVALNLQHRAFLLSCTRIEAGRSEAGWLPR